MRAQPPIVSAATNPAETDPDMEAIWWMPPSSPKTVSEVGEVLLRFAELGSQPLSA